MTQNKNLFSLLLFKSLRYSYVEKKCWALNIDFIFLYGAHVKYHFVNTLYLRYEQTHL